MKQYFTEDEMLLQIAKGDEFAFEQLFNLYKNKLYSFALKVTGSKKLAEDIVQDTFLKIWVLRENLPQIQNINSYTFKITQNNIYNGFRRNAKKQLILAEIEKRNSSEFASSENLLLAKEVNEFINAAVNKLTPQQKKVYVLSREKRFKNEEIANELNISVYTVKKHLTDALKNIKSDIVKNFPMYAQIIFIIFSTTFYTSVCLIWE